jgi:predicted dehydrogenase
MAISVSECEAMIAACSAANVKLMIAYRCHYDPIQMKAIQMIREGVLGKVSVIQGGFGGSQPAGEWRITKILGGGGSLLDLGIYPLNAARYLTGEEPVQFAGFVGTVDHDGRFDEVDESVSWTMRFPSGIISDCSSSYGASIPGYFKVSGEKGWLEMISAYSYDGVRLREADHLAECILENKTPKTPGEEGLRDMRYIKEIYRTAGVDVL